MDYVSKKSKESLRQDVHRNGKLQDLCNSSLADHLGVDILLFSGEGHLVIGRRAGNLAVTPYKLGPAGAGALTNEDTLGRDKISMRDVPLCRELLEETGLTAQDISQLIVLGVVRDLLRGGKPQLIVEVHCKLRSETICANLDGAPEPEHRKLVAHDVGLRHDGIKLDLVREKLGQLVLKDGDSMTEPLLGALSLWWRSIASAAGQAPPLNPPMQTTGSSGG